jgi:hypothetical protein
VNKMTLVCAIALATGIVPTAAHTQSMKPYDHAQCMGPGMMGGAGMMGPGMGQMGPGMMGGMMGPGMMGGAGMVGPGMGQTGPGMMGGMIGPGMMSGMGGHGRMGGLRVMMALMDTDGDSALTLQEAQAAQARVFAAIDGDEDGRVTPEEIVSFMHGGPDAAPDE